MQANKWGRFMLLFLIMVPMAACEKFVNIPAPSDQLTETTLFSDDLAIGAAVTGMYSFAFQESEPFSSGMELYVGLMPDEFYYQSMTNAVFSTNTYDPRTVIIGQFWIDAYKIIYEANDLIINLPASTAITPTQKLQYIGEAKFFRAFSHFVLTNLYGRVPLILTTDIRKTANAMQVSQDSVYTQVIADMSDAETDLESSSNPKERITSMAAAALLARVYLYAKMWQQAEAKASEVINSGSFQLETDLNRVFLTSSNEAILQVSSQNSNPYLEGYTFVGASLAPQPGYPLTTYWTRA